MEVPLSPQTNTPFKIQQKNTDYSGNSRTSSEEESKKNRKIQPLHTPKNELPITISTPSGEVVITSPFYEPAVKQQGSLTAPRTSKYRKRSSSTAGIEYLVAPPIPPKPERFIPQKPPLPVANRRVSLSFSTSDLTKISPSRPAPLPPIAQPQIFPALSPLSPLSPIFSPLSLTFSPLSPPLSPLSPASYNSEVVSESWSQAEKGIYPPAPPKRNENTRIMPQEEFESLEFSMDINNSPAYHKKAPLKRTKSVENTNKINYSASYEFLGDDETQPLSCEGREECVRFTDLRKIQRKDASQFDISRTKSLEFESNQTGTFTPMPGSYYTNHTEIYNLYLYRAQLSSRAQFLLCNSRL